MSGNTALTGSIPCIASKMHSTALLHGHYSIALMKTGATDTDAALAARKAVEAAYHHTLNEQLCEVKKDELKVTAADVKFADVTDASNYTPYTYLDKCTEMYYNDTEKIKHIDKLKTRSIGWIVIGNGGYLSGNAGVRIPKGSETKLHSMIPVYRQALTSNDTIPPLPSDLVNEYALRRVVKYDAKLYVEYYAQRLHVDWTNATNDKTPMRVYKYDVDNPNASNSDKFRTEIVEKWSNTNYKFAAKALTENNAVTTNKEQTAIPVISKLIDISNVKTYFHTQGILGGPQSIVNEIGFVLANEEKLSSGQILLHQAELASISYGSQYYINANPNMQLRFTMRTH